MKKLLLRTLTAFTIAFAPTAFADTPAGGIGGLAMSPDGTMLLAAGDTRTIYALNPQTLEVTNRIYAQSTIVWMTYRNDGQVVFTRDTDGTITALDANSFQVLWTQTRTEGVDYAPLTNQLAYIKRERRNGMLVIVDGATFAQKAQHDLGEMSPRAIGISPEGARAVVISYSEKRESEEKKRPGNDLKGVEKEIYRQQNDQRGAKIAQVDLLLGKVDVAQSWYKSDNIKKLAVTAAGAHVLSYGAEVASLTAGGEVEIIDAGARYRYGAAMTANGDGIVSGSMREITVKTLASDAAQVFKLDQLPGWPEYVIRFATSPDGKIYGATTAYRVIEIDPASGAVRSAPIY